MRVVITGGGTAGHVSPALAVAQALVATAATGPEDVLYVGSVGGLEERLVADAGFPFRGIAAGALRGKSPWAIALNLARLGLGLAQSIAVLRSFRPGAVLATGGYVSVPVAAAAWLLRVPSLVYLPDVEPGLAVRLLSRLVGRVAVTCEESRRFLPAGKTVVTGYPVRAQLRSMDKAEARRLLGLPQDGRVLLVLGGSRGARSVNVAVSRALESLLEICVIVHSSGAMDYDAMKAKRGALPLPQRERYRLYPYLSAELAAALSAADLAVSRAGASTMGEFPAFGLPSLLVPYPFAGAHQRRNADHLASRGAAVVLDNADLDRLPGLVAQLLGDDERLRGMAHATSVVARPTAAADIAAEVVRLAGQPEPRPADRRAG